MTVKLKLLLRVVQRRMITGEGFEEILRDYPKLTEEERAEIKTHCERCVDKVQ